MLARGVGYRRKVRWLLTWAVVLGVSACGSAQYEARSSYDAAPPPMAPYAASPENDSADAYESFSSEMAVDADDGSFGGGEEGTLPESNQFAAPQRSTPELVTTQMSAASAAGPQRQREPGMELPGALPGPQLAGGRQAAGQPQASGQGNVALPAPSVGSKPTSEATRQLPKQLLLIYRAQLVLAVFETRATLDKIELLARDMGGYLVSRSNDAIEVRVPVAKFEQALKEAAGLGDELDRNVSAEDVSDQYRDLNIRLRNAEAVRERLAALLARATDVKEALLVEEQLGRVTTTIEQIKGKLKVLDELIAFSTITIRLRAQASHENLKPRVALPFPWLRELGLSNLLNLEER